MTGLIVCMIDLDGQDVDVENGERPNKQQSQRKIWWGLATVNV